MWVIPQCPEMVKGHLQCGKDTAYDVVHVLRYLDLKDMNQDINYDKMTAVVRYQKPYIVKGRGPFILSFALGHGLTLPFNPLGRLLVYFLGNLLVQNSI